MTRHKNLINFRFIRNTNFVKRIHTLKFKDSEKKKKGKKICLQFELALFSRD